MISTKLASLKRSYGHWRGWRTTKRYLVIESDDWGSIRTSSADALDFLSARNYPVKKNPYNRYDSLESNGDMELLLDVLQSVRNRQGISPVFTANQIVANPDFARIKDSGFQQYFFEPCINTYDRYPDSDRVVELCKEGVEQGIWIPQLHGREHVNVKRWLGALQAGETASLDAFYCGMFSLHAEERPANRNEFMEAFDGESEEEHQYYIEVMDDATRLFTQYWGMPSKSFIACCYIWHPRLEAILKQGGVQYLQGLSYQFIPIANRPFQYKQLFHYMGQRSSNGLRYLTRNVFFEPASNPGFNWIDDCLSRIQLAFNWGAPAILSTHRVNFIGRLDPENRSRTLRQFHQLLQSIIKQWPDIEFVSSDKLGEIIENNH